MKTSSTNKYLDKYKKQALLKSGAFYLRLTVLKQSSECNLTGNSQQFSEGMFRLVDHSYPPLTSLFPPYSPSCLLSVLFLLVLLSLHFLSPVCPSASFPHSLMCLCLLPFSPTLSSLIVKQGVFWTTKSVWSWFWSALVLKTMNDRSPYPLATRHSIGLWPRPTSGAFRRDAEQSSWQRHRWWVMESGCRDLGQVKTMIAQV